jgi:hypothetical protein
VNALAGSAIDIVYGVILAMLFSMLRASLPGATSLMKGVSFASAHVYTLVAGLVQVLLVAAIIAILLPQPDAARFA